MLNRAYAIVDLKSIDDERRVITGMASTPSVDRQGDIVDPMGLRAAKDIPLFLYHDSNQTVGRTRLGKPTKAGIPFEASIPHVSESGRLKDRVDEAWQMLKYRLITGVSIGFQPVLDKTELMKDGGLRFTEYEVLELSLVPVPANAEATITSIKSIDKGIRAASGDIDPPAVVRLLPGSSGSTTKPIPKGNSMKTVSEQIADLQATRAAKAARMSEVMTKSLSEGSTTDAAEGEEFDTLNAEIKQIDIDLKRFDVLLGLQKQTATAVSGESSATASASRGGFATVRTPVKSAPGIDFARWAMCLGKAHGNIELASALAKEHYGQLDNVNLAFKGMREMGAHQFFKSVTERTKAAVPAASTTDAAFGGPLVAYNQFAGDFVEFLRPQSIIGKFGTTLNGVSIPDLNHIPFNVHIRGQTSGGSGYWVGQGAAKPLTRTDFNDTYLGFTKLANIAVLTEELMRFSDPSAETLVRNMLAGAIVQRMDMDFVDPTNAGIAGVKPASITYGATTVVSTGAAVDNIRQDIDALWNAAAVANLPMDSAVYITDARTARRISLLQTALGQPQFLGVTMRGGTLDGVPIIVSNNLPTPTAGSIIVLAFASEIWLADDGQVSIAASTEASLEMSSTPTGNSTVPTAATMVSMFQTDSVALRAERYINWAKRRALAVSYVTGVNYTP